MWLPVSRHNSDVQSRSKYNYSNAKQRLAAFVRLAQCCAMSVSAQDTPRVWPRRGLGPHTRQHRLLEGIDWRTREGQVLIAARAELTAHVGGNPNNVQKALIERAARLTLYVELMDAEALVAGTMTERNSRMYLAWVNALRLCLRDLGVKEAASEKPSSLANIVSRHKAAAP
jgi:hypothetical protein